MLCSLAHNDFEALRARISKMMQILESLIWIMLGPWDWWNTLIEGRHSESIPRGSSASAVWAKRSSFAISLSLSTRNTLRSFGKLRYYMEVTDYDTGPKSSLISSTSSSMTTSLIISFKCLLRLFSTRALCWVNICFASSKLSCLTSYSMK